MYTKILTKIKNRCCERLRKDNCWNPEKWTQARTIRETHFVFLVITEQIQRFERFAIVHRCGPVCVVRLCILNGWIKLTNSFGDFHMTDHLFVLFVFVNLIAAKIGGFLLSLFHLSFEKLEYFTFSVWIRALKTYISFYSDTNGFVLSKPYGCELVWICFVLLNIKYFLFVCQFYCWTLSFFFSSKIVKFCDKFSFDIADNEMNYLFFSQINQFIFSLWLQFKYLILFTLIECIYVNISTGKT